MEIFLKNTKKRFFSQLYSKKIETKNLCFIFFAFRKNLMNFLFNFLVILKLKKQITKMIAFVLILFFFDY